MIGKAAAGFLPHPKASSSDHSYSQAHIQRRADEHFHLHLKNIVEVLETLLGAKQFDRLVLGGSIEATSEMYRVLSKGMQAKVVESVALPMGASDSEVLATIEAVEQRAELGFELARVSKLLDASGGKQKATAGVDATLQAVNEKRVHELMYSEGPTIPGGLCRECGAVFPSYHQRLFSAWGLCRDPRMDEGFEAPPRQTFLVHGEPKAIAGMEEHIHGSFKNWKVHGPQYRETVDL